MAKYKKIILICDGCCKIPNAHIKNRVIRGPATCGYIILDHKENLIDSGNQYLGNLTPPQAEYKAVINGLELATSYCRDDVEVRTDSELVVKHMNGQYAIKSSNIKPLFDEIKIIERRFNGKVTYFYHGRLSKWAKEADKIANEAYNRFHQGS